MMHCGTQMLETNRLILRRFTHEDAPKMYRNWASDPEVTRYLGWPVHRDEAVSKAILEEWVPSYEKADYYHWVITLAENGYEPVGSIGVVRQDEATAMFHIGYCLGRNWWHRGIMSEALKAVMDYLFDVAGANRIEARFDPRNVNSGKVMEKCGMLYEGTMRQADFNNQGICDACYYAMLKSDR